MKMKKYLMAAALIGAISVTNFSLANARGNYGYGPGPGYGDCGGYSNCNNLAYSEVDNEKGATFYEETKESRKGIIVKKSELDALMRQDNPDEKKVAKLTGEIYDLQALMEEKAAKTYGDSQRYGYGRGRGGYGNCGRGSRGW
jgi:Spy/CpxP family protein refolding chaperone